MLPWHPMPYSLWFEINRELYIDKDGLEKQVICLDCDGEGKYFEFGDKHFCLTCAGLGTVPLSLEEYTYYKNRDISRVNLFNAQRRNGPSQLFK